MNVAYSDIVPLESCSLTITAYLLKDVIQSKVNPYDRSDGNNFACFSVTVLQDNFMERKNLRLRFVKCQAQPSLILLYN